VHAWIQRLTDRKAIVWYYLRTVFWGPLIVGATVMFSFATIPQSREIYLDIIESRKVFAGALGVVLVALLCALLDFWQYVLSNNAVDRMYLEHADTSTDG
jgi:hypothetical protein